MLANFSRAVAFVAVLGFAAALLAEPSANPPAKTDNPLEFTDGATFNLWPGRAPGAFGDKPGDTPMLQLFLPEAGKTTGSAIVVCPGGGYGGLAGHEGAPVGKWLAANGVTAFVLRYRVAPFYHFPAPVNDGQRAIRFVRSHAEGWHLDPHRIGILGFSAGGHLCTTIATHFDPGDPKAADPIDRVSSRPDLQIPVYPVVTMSGPGTHAGSRNNLLGVNATNEMMEKFSNQMQVTKETPPAFVVHSTTDKVVPVSNSDDYVAALKAAGVEVQYVRGELGPHGFGLKEFWTKPCVEWLRKLKF